MRKTKDWAIITLLAFPLVAGAGFVFTTQDAADGAITPISASGIVSRPPVFEETISVPTTPSWAESSTVTFVAPIADAARRVTKKPFGIEIHPETSPVPNDRFDGFHVGVDFETFEDEQDIEVPIFAICGGPLRFKKYAQGYGGVAVQACRLEGEDVSVIYGHLNVASVLASAGDMLAPGQRIGALGKGYSEETNGVRKHLHLGIRKGLTNDIRGYVQSATETEQFVDPLSRMPL